MARVVETERVGPASREGVLRLMTFNMRAAVHLDGRDAWWFRRRLAMSVLRTADPDILGLQEAMRTQVRAVQRALRGFDYHIGVPTGSRFGPRCYNALFWRRDRVRVRQTGSLWLSETPERFSRGWGAPTIRGASWMRASTPVGETVVFNTHLDHRVAEARRQGAALIGAQAADATDRFGCHAVLLGDFNANPGSPVHRQLLADGFVDAHGELEREADYTFHGFTGRRCPPDGRIDWILCSPSLASMSSRIVRDGGRRGYPSDHFPVLSELVVAEGDR